MKSKVIEEPAAQESKVIIYEETGTTGKGKARDILNLFLAFHQVHPELYKKFQQEQAKNA